MATILESQHTPHSGNSNSAEVNTDVESDREKPTVDNSAPEGGARAWLVAGGGACVFFCTLGFANSFGAFEEYYLSHQMKGESPSKVAWIGSLAMFFQFFAGMLGGPLFDRHGEKVWLTSLTLPVILYIVSCQMLICG